MPASSFKAWAASSRSADLRSILRVRIKRLLGMFASWPFFFLVHGHMALSGISTGANQRQIAGCAGGEPPFMHDVVLSKGAIVANILHQRDGGRGDVAALQQVP
jgi:hypothetical protein